MQFAEFKLHFQNNPLFSSQDALYLAKDPQILRNQLSRWQKKGLIISLRKGIYLLSAPERRLDPEPGLIANRLYEPSYLSLEWALNFYGLIPEKTLDLTSITTRKTMRFKNEFGYFSYQHVKPRAFRGFKKIGAAKAEFFLAEPEKALADFLYLNLAKINHNSKEYLRDSLRLQNIEELDKDKLKVYAQLFENKKLMQVIGQLLEVIKGVLK